MTRSRITSYNVCYTKLLRAEAAARQVAEAAQRERLEAEAKAKAAREAVMAAAAQGKTRAQIEVV